MDRCQCLNRFQFDDHRILHNKIQPVAGIQFDSVINNWQRNLTRYLQTTLY